MNRDFTVSQLRELLTIALDRADANGPHADALARAVAPDATIAELTEVKDTAKRLIAEAPDKGGREAAQLVYHAAVAAALVRHGAAISSRAPHKQRPVYEQLAETTADVDLRELFRAAASRIADGSGRV